MNLISLAVPSPQETTQLLDCLDRLDGRYRPAQSPRPSSPNVREPVACALQVGDSPRYRHEIINKRYGHPPTWTLIALLIQNVPIRMPFPIEAE